MNSRPSICVERLRLMTEAYQESEGDPPVITRAKCLNKVLAEMPIAINDLELIVGNVTARPPRGAPITPEFNLEWVDEEIDTIDTRPLDRLFLSSEEKAIVRQYALSWRGRTLKDRYWALVPEDAKRAMRRLFATSVGIDMGRGHTCVDYERVLGEGLEAVKKEAEDRLANLDPRSAANSDKIHFYEAVAISCGAVVTFARRYAELARAEAARPTTPPERRRELETIAEICQRVPAQPARTFHEALQSCWFVQCALFIEDPAYGFILGRVDQYLYDLYKQDLDTGRLSRDDARELIQHLYIKLNEPHIILKSAVARFYTGQPLAHNIVLGGLTRDGRDGTNELSSLFLDAEMGVRLVQPDLMVRVDDQTPDEFLLRACEVAKVRAGKEKFLMDDTAIRSMVAAGKTLEDARDYVLVGCMEPFVPGKSQVIVDGQINLVKCLELALNNGIDPVGNDRLGPETGRPEEFQSYQDLMTAFRRQIESAVRAFVELRNTVLKLNAQYAPVPLQSALTQDCLARGLDLMDGGAEYSNRGILAAGTVNVGDSLAVIKKLVFDDRQLTLKALADATRANFAGQEGLLDAIARIPKFGNDDDYVDLIVKDVVSWFCEEVEKHRDHRGAQYIVSLAVVTSNIPYGGVCGATPDGRLAGAPLAEGGISPHQGRNISGATATMKSVAKVDLAKAKNGSVLNMRFAPGSLDSQEKLRRLAMLLQTYRELGGYLVQFNIVDSRTLKDAQVHPEEHRDLTVRVATYSSLFVELSKELQDDIIARIEIEEV